MDSFLAKIDSSKAKRKLALLSQNNISMTAYNKIHSGSVESILKSSMAQGLRSLKKKLGGGYCGSMRLLSGCFPF